MLYQHEDTKIAVRLLANDVHLQEYHVTASPTGIHNEQRWTSMVPLTVGQTLAMEYRIIGLQKSVMVDVKVDGCWRFRKIHGPDETVRQLLDTVVMKEKHALFHAKMCAKEQSNPDPYGSDDDDDDFAPVKGSPAFEVGNIELLFFTAQPETGNSRGKSYTYRKGPYFENDPERGFTQRAASDTKLTSKVYQEAGPATCSIDLLKGSRLSESEEATVKFGAKRPLLSPIPFVTFKFLYRDQRVLNYQCEQPSQDITSASVSSGFWAPLPSLPSQQILRQAQQPQEQAEQSRQSPLSQQPPQHPRKKTKKHKRIQNPYIASNNIGAGAGQMPYPPTVTYPPNVSFPTNVTYAPNVTYPPAVRNPPLFEPEQVISNNIPSGPELITPSSPVAESIYMHNSLPVAATVRQSLPVAATVLKSSLAKPHQASNRKPPKTVRFAPVEGAEIHGESNIDTPASPADDEGRDFSDEKYIRCLSIIGDRTEPPSRRLIIRNLGLEATEQDLKDLFQGFIIRNVEIPIVPRTQKPGTFGYVVINTQAEADRAILELAGKMVRSSPVTIKPVSKPKDTEMEKRPETEIEAAMAAESFLDEFVPDVLRNDTPITPIAGRRRLGSPPLAESDLIAGQHPSSVNTSVPASDQTESLRLTSSIQTRKRKLGEMEEFRQEMEGFRKRQREEMDGFHKRQREEMEEFQKRQREEIEEKMEDWKAETADLERTAKRRKIVRDKSVEPDATGQATVGSRDIEGGGDGVEDAGDAAETGAADAANTTYGPHELNLRALSERLGRIDDLKSRQADGETLETSDLLEIKMEDQVRLELSMEIKSSPGLEPRTMDADQDVPQLDLPDVAQTDVTRNAGTSTTTSSMAGAGHDRNENEAANPDVKMENREFGETTNASGTGTSRAEKTRVYIKLEDDDD